jgi:uncharacterized protein (TIGR02569 family)
VLRAFGGSGSPVPLSGGEGLTWRAGDIVVKRVHDDDEAAWCQATLAGVVEDGFRIPRPRTALDGRWVVDGWSACSFVEGLRDGSGRYRDILDAGARLHRALPAPDTAAREVLRRRTHRWAIADRVAWGEAEAALSDDAGALHRRVVERVVPVEHDDRIVHGDLAGNVAFDPDGTPVVLDFSPYIRPPRYAGAIVVADALLWEGAGPDLLDVFGRDDEATQLLLRALVFRLVAEDLGTAPRHGKAWDPFQRVLEWLGVPTTGARTWLRGSGARDDR